MSSKVIKTAAASSAGAADHHDHVSKTLDMFSLLSHRSNTIKAASILPLDSCALIPEQIKS